MNTRPILLTLTDGLLSAPARLVLSATLEQELIRRAQEGARYASEHMSETLPVAP